MVDVIRVSNGVRWTYVSADKKGRMARLAEAGLADVDNVGIRLRSEAGPVVWDLLAGRPSSRRWSAISPALRGRGIVIAPDEVVSFGRPGDEDILSYNEFADMYLARSESCDDGVEVARSGIEDGDVLLTAWPVNGTVMPARATRGKRGIMTLEMPERTPRGGRCFVLDEDARLLTASMPSEGSFTVRVINPVALLSWLLASGSMSVIRPGRFALVDDADGRFIIADNKTGERYSGRFRNYPMLDADKWVDEKNGIEWTLSIHGIGGLLPAYEMENSL